MAVPNFVSGSVSNPVGKGTVLLLLFCKEHFLAEGLEGSLRGQRSDILPFSLIRTVIMK